MKSRHIPYGFTLMEIMFVILLIATISLYGLNVFRAESKNSTVQKVAVEMKQLLEASGAYYIRENDEWPQEVTDLVKNRYTNTEGICSPWLGAADGNTACNNKQNYRIAPFPEGHTYKNAKYFGISVKAPSNDIAKQLANQLPSSAVDPVDNTVSAYIPVPGTASNFKGKGWIEFAGIAGYASEIPLPVCPPGYQGHFLTAPQYYPVNKDTISLGKDQRHGVHIKNTGPRRKALSGPFSSGWITKLFTDGAVIKENQYKGNFSNRVYFITFCVPDNQWLARHPKTVEDAQIDGNWETYQTATSGGEYHY